VGARGAERQLLEDEADPDVRRLQMMAKAIAKDVHRMHAFVRFREGRDADGAPLYAAWFEPEHDILAKGAPFFVERLKDLRWVIVTPRGAARWDAKRLEIRSAPLGEAAADYLHDPVEQLWRTYYAAVFNPARCNPRRLAQEMPRRWRTHLPEARDIPALVAAAGPRVAAMPNAEVKAPRWSARAVAAFSSPEAPSAGTPHACRRCPLWERATQAVCGAGPRDARLMLVGEQPGDEEDLRGTPFVGPAGQVLSRALDAAGIQREKVYLTNAVKHFKWEPRGKRRMHRTPAQREVDECADWLYRELQTVKPKVVVAMGATASYALTGEKTPIARLRSAPLEHASGARLVVTYHPAAVLRADDDGAEAFYRALCRDLAQAARLAA
jgi:DNA polymerase